VKPKATCHVTRQSKHQCTCLGSASSPFREGWKFPRDERWKGGKMKGRDEVMNREGW